MEFLFEILINGVKNFGVEIVVLVLLAVFWRLFPRARSLVKKDDEEELARQKQLEADRIKLEVERQVQDKQKEEERLKAEAKKQEEGPTDAQAQFELGKEYYKKKYYDKATYWYRKAADQGYARAQNNLGSMYYEGNGVKQDYEEAVKWYRKAAEQELASAQFNLGNMYYEGKGVEQDYEEAVFWYDKAAQQGIDYAQDKLGHMYKNGLGVKQDYKEAAKWYHKANSYTTEKWHEKIKNICNNFQKTYGYDDDWRYRPKLIVTLGASFFEEEVYLAHDDSLFQRGACGFAITDKGIYCLDNTVMFEEKNFMSFEKLARARNDIYLKNVTSIYADGAIIAVFSGSSSIREKLKNLFEDIAEIAYIAGLVSEMSKEQEGQHKNIDSIF